ncbi:MAG: polyphosphate kinase 1 [Anaerolineae bacterium]|nr:polyphosphate kinase 1 [Anaerolineae bacterium]
MSISSLPELNTETYINRELSNIQFQWRVLALAQDERVPLLERVKFVAIVGNNMDEFFMVRVASHMQKMQHGGSSSRPDGHPPAQLVRLIRDEVTRLNTEQRRIKRDLLAKLALEGILLLKPDDLTAAERAAVRAYFEEVIYPVLTPLAVDHARPFPFISNLSLNLGIYLERASDDGELEFARIKIPTPDVLPRLVRLEKVMQRYAGLAEAGTYRFLWVEDVIQDNLSLLFPGMHVLEAAPFRVLRNADIDYEHEQDEEDLETVDVMDIIEQSVRERRFGTVTRVAVPTTISPRMLRRILDGLEVDEEVVYRVEGTLGLANLFELAAVDRPDLKYPPFAPRIPEPLVDTSIFAAIRRGDILLHHPYDSFDPVADFFRQAARDPQVLAIKATLYRAGKNSPVVQALMEARDNDRQVTVLVELKARFDEENNLEWARALEDKGVHVIYGVEELPVKTHAKIALVVRRESDGVRRYLHLGTGNYNASTARLYTDLALLTCNPQLADDATRLFNRLTGYAPATTYNRLLVAPEHMLRGLLALIDQEIAAAQAGHPARLIFKMNQLEEDLVIQKLYQASQAGVKVDLLVRGLCCLRPGVPGLSDQIRVTSIVGRFLEHSRIYYFQNAPAEARIYLGSADCMRRNLYNRVEVLFPVLEERLRKRILRVLATSLVDNQGTWELHADRQYHKVAPADQSVIVSSQEIFMHRSFGLDLLP